jgi:hypothetical protein
MGIVFEQVSEKQEARLRKFIAKQGDSLLV